MAEKRKKASNRMTINDLMQQIVAFFNAAPNNQFNYKQVSHALGLNLPAQKQKVYEVLATMAQQEFLIETSPGRFKKKDRGTRVVGTFERRSNGKNQVVTEEGEEITFRIAADGFLYNMVRIMAGTLLDVAKGSLMPDDIDGITLGCDRRLAGATAPAHGLYLNRVSYEKYRVI